MEFIQFETAKLAKEKGFDLEVDHFFKKDLLEFEPKSTYDFDNIYRRLCNFNSHGKSQISRPYQSQLQDWLRKEHGIIVYVKTYAYEAPGEVFLLPVITTTRGSDYRYDKKIQVYNEHREDNITAFSTGIDESILWNSERIGDYELAFEDVLVAALKII